MVATWKVWTLCPVSWSLLTVTRLVLGELDGGRAAFLRFERSNRRLLLREIANAHADKRRRHMRHGPPRQLSVPPWLIFWGGGA
jgi:hypothetical protein